MLAVFMSRMTSSVLSLPSPFALQIGAGIHCCVIEKNEADRLCSVGLLQRRESREDCIGNFRSRNCPRDNSRPGSGPGHWCPACALPAKVHWLHTT